MSVKLQTSLYQFDGRTFKLRCNMNVLAEVQEVYGGNLEAALRPDSSLQSATVFFAAMLNDYADEQNWPVRYNAKTVGRMLDPADMAQWSTTVMKLVASAFTQKKKKTRLRNLFRRRGNRASTSPGT